MPIYEFRCEACRKKFEKIVLSGAVPASAQCPKCGKKGAERVVSRFATSAKSGGDDWGGDFGGDEGGDEGGDGGGDDLGGGGGAWDGPGGGEDDDAGGDDDGEDLD